MNSDKSDVAVDPNEEVPALIETLHDIGQRLEQLTAGEVDTVADRDGRAFLLQRAQEHLRQREVAKQAAILNALPAHIALLDSRGCIVSVNDAWRRFAGANLLQGPGHEVGANYLDICDSATGDDAAEVHQVAAGIRSVLAGREKKFSIEYPAHAPTEQRWFLLTATPLADDRLTGAVVMHLNITERKRAEQAVLESGAHLRFMNDLARVTRTLAHPPEIMAVMARMLGQQLRASRCAYADVDSDGKQFTILHDYTDGCASTVGRYDLSLFGARAVATLNSGQTLIVRNVDTELLPGDGADMFNAIGIKAIMTCPLVKNGVLRALMAVHQATPRDWTSGDVAMVQEVVERCWATIERRTAEEKVLQMQALLDIVGNTASLGVWAVDLPDRITWSDQVCVIHDVLPGTVPGLEQAFSFYAPQSRGTVRKAFAACAQQGTPFDLELEIITGNGRHSWVRSIGEAQRNLAGAITRVQGAFLDITASKHTQLALAQSEAGLHRAQLMAKLAHVITGPDGALEDWSESLAQLLGVDDAHVPASTRDWLKIVHDDDRVMFKDRSIEAAKTGKRTEVEYRLRRADGAWIYLRQTTEPTADRLRWFNTIQDITEQKHAEAELRESERRYSDMLGNIEMISLMLDTNARITYCNDYLLRLTGWQREEVTGRDWYELFIPPDNTDSKASTATLLVNKPEASHHENEILTRSGERRLIRWNNSVLRSGAGDVIGSASIGEDITEQKRAEIGIKRLVRVYAVLSQINALIVRVRNRDELYSEVCRIAVEAGAFGMAWIGVIDPQTLDGKVVAWHGGERGYVELVKLTARDGTPDSERPACRALRQSQPVICNDIATDPGLVPLRDELLRREHKSTACFPLTVAGRTDTVIALFAGELNFFDDKEMRLLRELADNISFALDHIEKREKLDYLAYYDALTGLANRALFHERLEQGVANAKEQGRKLSLVILDIERFKTINDTLGRPVGDALLKDVAARMSAHGADVGRLARIDADHFALMVPEVQAEEDLARLIEQRIAEIFVPPFQIGDSVLRISAKFGIAMFPGDGADADTLFRNAEAALEKAKARGDRYLFYTQSMNERVAENLSLENRLRQAIEKEEFVLHYQPKVNLASGELSGAEALIRWNDPRTGDLVPPGQFIPILEETGLIYEVGRWALRKAIEDYLRWCAAGLAAVPIAVNVSPLQLRNRGFISEIRQAICIGEHAAAGLELEITESVIMQDIKHSIATLQAIRAMGVSIAIDDFGTGFSSLSYLAKLPVDTLKVDRSFVVDMTAAPEGLALVATIINLGHSLKLNVVAEGVETEEQSRLLRVLNCDEMQGYLFSKPVPADIFETRFLAAPSAGRTK